MCLSSSSQFYPSPPLLSRQFAGMSDVSRRRLGTTNIHIMALDGIVNVNSLFTLALFLGLTWFPTTDPNSNLIDSDATCAAGASVAENLIASHVYSFSAFLFSSLVALAIKQAIRIIDPSPDLLHAAHVNLARFRAGILVSASGSVIGCGFLTLALMDLVQIKLGVLACRDFHTWAAIVPLVTLVPSALAIYVFLVLYAFTR